MRGKYFIKFFTVIIALAMLISLSPVQAGANGSSNAGLVSVASQTDKTPGAQTGADAGNAITWELSLANAKTALGRADVSVATDATFLLYSNAAFTTEIAGAVTLPLGVGDTVAYVKVTSQDATVVRHYAVTVNRTPVLVAYYEFNGNLNDEMNGSALTAFTSVNDGFNHNNKTSAYGVNNDVEDKSYWEWTSDQSRGGGFKIDLNNDISANYSIGVRFSYKDTGPGWIKIIDYKNLAADTGFYFYSGGYLRFYNHQNQGTTLTESNQIVDIIATRSTAGSFTAYIIKNGALVKEIEVSDSGGQAIPSVVDGKPRFGFFYDDTITSGEATTGGKVYSIKIWDGPITSVSAENNPMEQASPNASLTGVATLSDGTPGAQTGADAAHAIAWEVTVPVGTSALSRAGITVADNATYGLYSDAAFSTEILGAATLALAGGGNTTSAYIRVTAQDAVTVKYYAVAISTAANSAYHVTYDGNGNTGGAVPIDSGEYQASASATVLGNTGTLARDGYVFSGWNSNAAGTGTAYAAGNALGISADTTLYAIWKSSNANLFGLALSGGTPNPGFAAGTVNYAASVAYGVTSITATPTREEANATIAVNGHATASGQPSAAISLDVGANVITVVVTAQDGTTQKTYTVTVTRAEAEAIPKPAPTARPIEPGVEILVNGKAETAAASTTLAVGDKIKTTVAVDDEKVAEKLEKEGNHAVVTLLFRHVADIVVGQLNGQTVKNMEMKEAVLEVRNGNAIYILPASQINIDSVSAQMGNGIALKDIIVSVVISKPSAETTRIAEEAATRNGFQIVAEPVEFEIVCKSGNLIVEVIQFKGYVERLVSIPQGMDPDRITTGIILNGDGTFSHVPTVITAIDGKYYAKINSLTNSAYSVIWNPRAYADVETHWARDSVNDMSSRLVIGGVGENRFEPDSGMSRAEFVDSVVRGLGLLRPGTGTGVFADVKENASCYDAVSIAHEYGIISGYGNGMFGPDDATSREQAMSIIAKARAVTGLKAELTPDVEKQMLDVFRDSDEAADWARGHMAECIGAGIVIGKGNGVIGAKNGITRAEAAAMIQRLLKKSKLI